MLDRIIEPSAAAVTRLPTVRVSRSQWITALRMKSWLPEHRRGAEPIQLGELLLPRRVGATSTGTIRVLCLAPGEWLILAQESSAELQARLQPSLRSQGLTFTDWSDGFATFVVEGSMARTLLAKGCGLDLHPQSFPEGRCARTRFAQLPVILQCLSTSRFEVAAARSYSSCLHEWLIDAAAEWEGTRLA